MATAETGAPSASQRAARWRMRVCLVRVTASWGVPKASDVRVLTSQNTNVRPRRTMRSSSPSRQRQLRTTTWYPWPMYHSATASSPLLPRSRRPWVIALLLGPDLLHVDILERHDAHGCDEA